MAAQFTSKPAHLAIVGDEIHSYAPTHYNQRGVITTILSNGKVEVRLYSGTFITINRCDLEVTTKQTA